MRLATDAIVHRLFVPPQKSALSLALRGDVLSSREHGHITLAANEIRAARRGDGKAGLNRRIKQQGSSGDFNRFSGGHESHNWHSILRFFRYT